jgi:hypothetical protein
MAGQVAKQDADAGYNHRGARRPCFHPPQQDRKKVGTL